MFEIFLLVVTWKYFQYSENNDYVNVNEFLRLINTPRMRKHGKICFWGDIILAIIYITLKLASTILEIMIELR